MKMKNKKQEQIENKRRHKESLKRRSEPDLTRATPYKLEKPVILIVCEGQNTEKSYFDQFRLTSARLITLGKGYNTVSLVNEALRLSHEKTYDKVWCVFDKDDFSANDFNSAIQIATANGFGVAYSNQAFEYWLILHFEDHQGGPLPRTDYGDKLNGYINSLGANYEADTSKRVSEELFELLEAPDPKTGTVRRILAISRAKKIYAKYNHASPATEESSTTVFALVEEIMKYI